jgi:hypothetical protein
MLGVLKSLTSVLACSERVDSNVNLLHPSFRDYLLDSKRCKDPRFGVAEGEAHQSLLASCIRIMSGSLKEDICSLKVPGRLVSEVDGGLIQRSLPPQVRYACRYWFDHLKRSNDKLRHHESLHELVHTFLKQHLLHWLEALSLMGSMSDGVLIVLNFDSILTVSKPTCVELYLPVPGDPRCPPNGEHPICGEYRQSNDAEFVVEKFYPIDHVITYVCFSAENIADFEPRQMPIRSCAGWRMTQFDSYSDSDRCSRPRLSRYIARLSCSVPRQASSGKPFGGPMSRVGSKSHRWFLEIGTRCCEYFTVIPGMPIQYHSRMKAIFSQRHRTTVQSGSGIRSRGLALPPSRAILGRSMQPHSHLMESYSHLHRSTAPFAFGIYRGLAAVPSRATSPPSGQ